MPKLNGLLHQNLRLAIMSFLVTVEITDFKKLMEVTEATKGNLSAQLSKLEAAEYLEVKKSFKGKYPHTEYNITKVGKAELKTYINHVKLLLNI